MRRKDNLIKLGDAIQLIFKQEKLDVKISRHAVKSAWEEIAGKVISNHTTSIFFDEAKNIYLTLDSSVVKNEAMYAKEKIVKTINEFCGYELVKNLIIK